MRLCRNDDRPRQQDETVLDGRMTDFAQVDFRRE